MQAVINFYPVFSVFLPAVSPSDNSRTFGLSSVRPIDAPSLKQANGDLRLGPHWRPQSPKSPKSPKVLRLSPQESRYSTNALFLLHKHLIFTRIWLDSTWFTTVLEFLGAFSLSMRAKLLESDSNESGESKDDFEEYRPSTPTPLPAQNGMQRPLSSA